MKLIMTVPYVYRAKVLDVHDGDTVTLDIDLGFGLRLTGLDWGGKTTLTCRVYGINAPELSTEAGKGARSYAQALLPLGAVVTVLSHSWDKYGGRFDGTVTLPDGRDLAEEMVTSGHAVWKTYSAPA